MKAYKQHSLFLIAGALLAMAVGTAVAAPPLSGAIFTTDSTGSIVNGNTKYEAKCGALGVWLDGGPPVNAPSTAAGLPDGDYYFQVTDPSGKKLLSTDPVEDRCVTVIDGVMNNVGCAVNSHVTMPSVDAGGGIVVELCPYLDTPNNGGVYKAWVTPIADLVGDPANVDNSCGNGCFHGFLPAASKTDNFKVKDVRTFCLNVHKDVRDDKGQGPGAGWHIWVTDPIGTMTEIITGADGNAELCGLVPGFYKVEEHLMDGYIVIGTKVNGQSEAPTTTVNVQLKKGMKSNTATVEYVNEECSGKDCEQ